MNSTPVSIDFGETFLPILLVAIIISTVVLYLVIKHAVMNALQDYGEHAAKRHHPVQERAPIDTSSPSVTGFSG